ncbi:hypothetical protein CLV24_101239 [Pontibacter ummariensis]|uniref:Uncharacterized protein n=1 Tax=Pontibacter ummariensis TaxID=1610492 RepID=A0A239B9U9_9BACT|nr:hypothetical protein CLV24_101239 [Pontibacter ummariensis]SNS04392.1 hypothetical protein SAMN06296052_101239 [Pontibacter ummariensis]
MRVNGLRPAYAIGSTSKQGRGAQPKEVGVAVLVVPLKIANLKTGKPGPPARGVTVFLQNCLQKPKRNQDL